MMGEDVKLVDASDSSMHSGASFYDDTNESGTLALHEDGGELDESSSTNVFDEIKISPYWNATKISPAKHALHIILVNVLQKAGRELLLYEVMYALDRLYGLKKSRGLYRAVQNSLERSKAIQRSDVLPDGSSSAYRYTLLPEIADAFLRARSDITLADAVSKVKHHYCSTAGGKARVDDDDDDAVPTVVGKECSAKQRRTKPGNPMAAQEILQSTPDLIELVKCCLKEDLNGEAILREIVESVNWRLNCDYRQVYGRVQAVLLKGGFRVIEKRGMGNLKRYGLLDGELPQDAVPVEQQSSTSAIRKRASAGAVIKTPPTRRSERLDVGRPSSSDVGVHFAHSPTGKPNAQPRAISGTVETTSSQTVTVRAQEIADLHEKIADLEAKLEGYRAIPLQDIKYSSEIGCLEVSLSSGAVRQLIGSSPTVRVAMSSMSMGAPVIGARVLDESATWRQEWSGDQRQLKLEVTRNEIDSLLNI